MAMSVLLTKKAIKVLKLIGATAENTPEPTLEKATWLLKLTSRLARHAAEEIEAELEKEIKKAA